MNSNTLRVTNDKIGGSQRVKNGACNMDTNKTRAEKSLETKKDRFKQKYCLHCGSGIIRNGTQGRKQYCNDACKQADYRWRKSLNPKPVLPVVDRTAQQMINIAWAHLAELETAL